MKMTRLDEQEKPKTTEPPSFAMFTMCDVNQDSFPQLAAAFIESSTTNAGNMKRWSFHAAEQRLITNTNLPVYGAWC
jgi:hypothetical protein